MRPVGERQIRLLFKKRFIKVNVLFQGKRIILRSLCNIMKKRAIFLLTALTLAAAPSCTKSEYGTTPDSKEADTATEKMNLENLARMFSELPLGEEQLKEVHCAASASSGNGYDEEYTMKDVLSSPGAGVGDNLNVKAGKAPAFETPLRNLIRDYLKAKYPQSKGGDGRVEDLMDELAESGYQIYWPYSEDWDGKSFPIITFDPGFGAETNYGFEISVDENGKRRVDSVTVTEAVAMERPVWVLNTNDDSAFTPLELVKRTKAGNVGAEPQHKDSAAAKSRMLMLKSFTMLRNYDSWFGGASEFFVKCGSLNGFTAATEAELKLYSPSVTDMMIVVKRKYKGVPLDLNSIIMTSFTNQLDQLVFLITEDDGGTITSWKCSAVVKVSSRSYGFDVDIPYRDKDDIVWRGQLSASFFQSEDIVKGRFGDVEVSFALE